MKCHNIQAMKRIDQPNDKQFKLTKIQRPTNNSSFTLDCEVDFSPIILTQSQRKISIIPKCYPNNGDSLLLFYLELQMPFSMKTIQQSSGTLDAIRRELLNNIDAEDILVPKPDINKCLVCDLFYEEEYIQHINSYNHLQQKSYLVYNKKVRQLCKDNFGHGFTTEEPFRILSNQQPETTEQCPTPGEKWPSQEKKRHNIKMEYKKGQKTL